MNRCGFASRRNWPIEGPITENRRPKNVTLGVQTTTGARTEKAGPLLGARRWIDGECYHQQLSFLSPQKLETSLNCPSFSLEITEVFDRGFLLFPPLPFFFLACFLFTIFARANALALLRTAFYRCRFNDIVTPYSVSCIVRFVNINVTLRENHRI